jgi:phenylalanyl-tRNA synthetase alpha chain
MDQKEITALILTKFAEFRKDEVTREVYEAQDRAAVEELRVKYLGRKGVLTRLLRSMAELPPEARAEAGKALNQNKKELEAGLEARLARIEKDETAALAGESAWLDISAPGYRAPRGHLHPITTVSRQVEGVFRSLGFHVLDGPEVESDFYNFEALNLPPDHPARDMQDTFWLKDGHLLRTHTSPVQVRGMQRFEPPFKAIAPGRCFRYEATDASHDNMFYQCEGLMIDRDISVANLIYSMKTLLRLIFGRDDVKIRLRPGYFPFVEPGFELDMHCLICNGKGCSVCKQVGWVEVLPCGLVHPNVLRHGGIDPEQFSGFAFGLGLTRLTMMLYGINDIRLLSGGDLRFLQQF